MRVYLVFGFLIALGACATVKLTEAGKGVKVVEKDFIKEDKCKKMDTFLHQNEMKFGGANTEIVVGDIKNKVGEMGGNTATSSFDFNGQWDSQTQTNIIPIGSRIPVNVYKCEPDFWNTLVGM